ncbi:MAG: flagellar hook-length control protein FliK [Bradyrhizobiaceae bacterium]|nr:MAG: flagellar hook-length control protein FliK [Bradyrhizobiaceae bacterium]
MAVAVNPVYPVIAAQGASTDITLQPGTVIDARVLKVLANDFVRIAVSNLAIEVMSEVPLQAGQALQLAVSQTPDGVRLQIVPQGAAVASPEAPATIVTTGTSGGSQAQSAVSSASVSSADASVDSARVVRQLTPVEALAVSAALQSAAAKQGSLSPLFANLGAAVSSGALPASVQQAAQQLLSMRTTLDPSLGGEDVRAAFETSGLFFERTQSTQGMASASQSAAPDMKAALIVLRQALSSSLREVPSPQTAAGNAASAASGETVVTDDHIQSPAGTFAQQGQARVQADLASPLAPPMAPEIEMDEILLPQAVLPVAEDIDDAGMIWRDVTPFSANAARAVNSGDIFSALAGKMSGAPAFDDVLQSFPKGVQDAVRTLLEAEAEPAMQRSAQPSGVKGEAGGPLALDDVPPPPFRGAAPSAQHVASPSLAPDASPDETVRQIQADTDAALARQTLLQIASLPDRADLAGARTDLNTPRWNFEIPFATPLGTAMAQFEISRDGGKDKDSAASANKVWRARFSLNVEPAGPVHALVSLSSEKTSVRMWAERASTAQQLRAGKLELTRALREAELDPGDIVIAEGQGPSSAAPPRGHFLDRAL